MNEIFNIQLSLLGRYLFPLPLLFSFILVATSCKTPRLEQVGQITYDLKINYAPKFVGEITVDNRRLLYFIEPNSAKWLRIADLNGNVLSTKSLVNIEKYFGDIENVNYLGLNRFLFQKKFSNKFVIVDSNLELIKEIDLNYKICDKDSNFLNLMGLSDIFYTSHKSGEVFFKVDPDFELMKRAFNNAFLDYFTIRNRLPYLCRIDNFLGDSISYSLLLDSFYSRINKKIFVNYDLNQFSITDSLIYINSGYMEYIGCYDRKGKLVNKWKVVSKYSDFGYPFIYVDESYALDGNESMDIMRQSGFIRDVFSIPGRNLFVVVAFHKDPKGSYKQRKPRDFSLIIYNSKYEKLCERKFIDWIYDSIVIIDGKIWMHDAKYKENGKVRYKIFDVID